MSDELDWKAALDHLLKVLRVYLDLLNTANTQLALTLTILPALKRYVAGERTQELYDDIMDMKA